MRISLICAMTKTHVIGYQGKLPWHLPEELQFFKKVTLNKPVIMGRKTYESIGKPLPKRRNIILTRDQQFKAPGCIIVNSVEAALKAANQPEDQTEEVMIIGGAEIYKVFLPSATRLYLSIVDEIVEGDTFFPEFALEDWSLTQTEKHKGFTIQILERHAAISKN